MTNLQHTLSPRLSLRLLGGFSVVDAEGRAPVLSYVKLRALLACLAVERGSELPRTWLAGLLWPELDDATARQNLRRALSNLRAALRDRDGTASCFRISRAAIGLNPAVAIDIDVADLLSPPVACDIAAFAGTDDARCRDCLLRMETMVARYRGELLPGFSLPDNPEFDEWLSARREMLHRHAALLLDRLAACHAARGEPTQALPFALRRLDLDPWDEAALRRVMRIYVAGGQAAAALTQFNAFRRELQDELGVQPDRETLRLVDEISPAVQRTAPAEAGRHGPEHRQVTVVCCHLVPPEGCDSDELIESLPALRQHCEALLREHGGHPAPMQGGVLAYFGYPRADEQAPLRAVGAALAVARTPAFAGVALRIGVHTGLVLTAHESGEVDVAGSTTGTAMALPAVIPGGTVAITQPTCRLVAGYYHCESLGDWRIGGAQRTLGLFRVLAPTGAEHRLQAMRNRLVPFVGREAELRRLDAFWREALAGRRQLVLVGGDAGIGKSRLVQSFGERLVAEGAQCIDLSCQAESAQEALRPLLSCLARYVGGGADEATADTGERLAQLARSFFPDDGERIVELGNWLLDAHAGAADAPGDDGRRRRMLALLLDLVDRYAAGRPLLVLLEDLHWADPSTLDLIAQFRARPTAARVMLLATARPEFAPPPAWSVLPLAALPAGAAAAMVEAIAAGRPLPAGLAARIVEFADGVPLFVEETARMVLKGAADGMRPELPTSIPHSLRDLLASKLDGLAEAKPLAQHAAVLGRRFNCADVAELMARPAAEIERLLARMAAAGLISREVADCQFRHALIREAAYQSLPPAKRRQLHRRAAELLGRRRAVVARQPGLLAHHHAAAGDVEQAIACHRQAAEQALRYPAYREYVWHLRQALALLERRRQSAPLPEQAALAADEVRLLVMLGWAVGEIEGLGSAGARDIYNRAFQLCRDAEGGPELFKTLLGLWRGSSTWSGYGKSLELGERLLAIAEKAGDAHQEALACYALGNVHCALGNLDTSDSYLRRCLAGYRPAMPVAAYGDSAGVGAHAFLGWVHTLRGVGAAGRREAQAAIALARRLDHPPAVCYALLFAAETHRLRREPQVAAAFAAEAAAVAEGCGIVAWAVFAEVFLGWHEALAGSAGGIARARRALDQVMGSIMAGTAAPLFAAVAEAALRTGEHAEGLRAVGAALSLMERNHGRHLQADLLLLRGELLQAIGRREEACASAAEALAVAFAQGARLFELRAAMALLRWQGRDRGHLARLRGLLGAFGDDADFSCRTEAHALLAAQGA